TMAQNSWRLHLDENRYRTTVDSNLRVPLAGSSGRRLPLKLRLEAPGVRYDLPDDVKLRKSLQQLLIVRFMLCLSADRRDLVRHADGEARDRGVDLQERIHNRAGERVGAGRPNAKMPAEPVPLREEFRV